MHHCDVFVALAGGLKISEPATDLGIIMAIASSFMQLHYSKHHKAYVDNLNAALEKYRQAESKNDIAAMISLQAAIKFNGGGHINHLLEIVTFCKNKFAKIL